MSVRFAAPSFWWLPTPAAAAQALRPLAHLYGALAEARLKQAASTLSIPVICVGNYVVGGAGKTPVVQALIPRLVAAGEQVFVLSRGYGGCLQGPVLVDPRLHTAKDVGDEPLLLSRLAPVVVAKDRGLGGMFAQSLGATLVLMDDGFQSPALQKTFSLVVVDGAVGVGNGLCLPAGPLRAPLDVQLPRTDALLVLGPGVPGETLSRLGHEHSIPVYHGDLVPDLDVAHTLTRQRVLAFAGIGRPEKFVATLQALGALVEETLFVPDHAVFSPRMIVSLLQNAKTKDLKLVTTEKDWVRLGHSPVENQLKDMTTVLPIGLQLANEEALYQPLLARLAMAKHSKLPTHFED